MKKAYIRICIISVIVYFVFGYTTQIFFNRMGDQIMKVADVPSYVWSGYNFFHFFKADSMRPLGYPILIGLPFLFNVSMNYVLYWGIVVNAIIWVLTSTFIYKTIRLFTNELYAQIFAIIFIFCVGNLEFTYLLLSENTYTFTLTLLMYLVATYLQKKELKYLGRAFITFCFSILIRPTFFPLFPIVFLAVILVGYKKIIAIKLKGASNYYVLILAGCLLIIGQLSLMKKDYGSYTLSYNGDRTMYIYVNAYANSLLTRNNLYDERNSRIDISNNLLSTKKYAKYDSLCKADLKYQLVSNTKNWLKALRTDIVCNMIMPGNFEDLKNVEGVSWFSRVISVCLVLSGWQDTGFTIFIFCSIIMALLLKKRLSMPALGVIAFNWACTLFLVLISGLSYWQNNRFSVVYTPEVLINMALLIWAVRNKMKRQTE